MLSKLPIATGFTPESSMGEHASLMQKKLVQQDQIKNMLNIQMQKRTEAEGQIKKEQIDHENQINQETKVGLEYLKEKKKKEKQIEKAQMQEEI